MTLKKAKWWSDEASSSSSLSLHRFIALCRKDPLSVVAFQTQTQKSQRFSNAISQIAPLPLVVALNRSFKSQIAARYAAFGTQFPKTRWPPSFRASKSQRLQDANATKSQTLAFYKSQHFSATKLLRQAPPPFFGAPALPSGWLRNRTGTGNRNRRNRFFLKPTAEPEPPEPFSRNRNRNRNRSSLLNCTETPKIPF